MIRIVAVFALLFTLLIAPNAIAKPPLLPLVTPTSSTDLQYENASTALEKEDYTAAAQTFAQLCRRRSESACYKAAAIYLGNHPDDPTKLTGILDKDEAKSLLIIGCRAEFGASCTELGYRQYTGYFGTPDIINGKRNLVRSCKSGVNEACRIIFTDRLSPPIEAKELEEVLKSLERQCLGDDWLLCDNWALVYQERGTAEGYRAANLAFSKYCDRYSLELCVAYGLNIIEGLGTEKNPSLGVSKLDLYCRNRNGMACEAMAKFYYEGSFVEKNVERAMSYHVLACNLFREDSCVALVAAIKAGEYVPPENMTGKHLFQKLLRANPSNNYIADALSKFEE